MRPDTSPAGRVGRDDGRGEVSMRGRCASRQVACIGRSAGAIGAIPRLTGIGILITLTAAAAGGCSSNSGSSNQYGVTASPRLVQPGEPVPSGGGYFKIGRPYKIAGRWYKPAEDPGYDEVGLASWYGSDFHGRRTANGEIFDMTALTAAHPTLPLPTYARVTNLENGSSVVVRVNDRGPFAHDRVIDLSRRTADVLGFKQDGTAKVRVQYVGMAPLDGNDGHWLTTTVRHDGQPVGPVMMASMTPPAQGYPPAPPPGTPSPDSQKLAGYQQGAAQPISVGFTQTNYAPAGKPQPSSAAFAPAASGPVPKAPVGTGKVTYNWVSGYARFDGNSTVANAFSMFDAPGEIVLVVQAPAPVRTAAHTLR